MSLITVIDAVLCLFYLLLLKKALTSYVHPHGLPPGPKGLPLLGNIFDMPKPTEKSWLHWQKLKKLYGPVLSVTVLGQTIVVLNEYDAAVELLEKNSAVCVNRLTSTFGSEMVGCGKHLALIQYGNTFHKYRRHLRQFLGTHSAITGLTPILETETKRFLNLILQDPTSWQKHIERTNGAIILGLTYGYKFEREGPDYLIELAEAVDKEMEQYFTAGNWVVDFLPALRFLPEWLPGMGFKRTAREWRAHLMEFINRPYQFAKQTVNSKNAPHSYVFKMLTSLSEPPSRQDETDIKWSAGSIYSAGTDTTISALCTFFLAMVLHPDVQRAAQKEIDEVVGGDRLPTLDDRSRLPYVNAVMNECSRWSVVVPMGVPRVSVKDYLYRGYRIPKGTTVLANLWEFSHNPHTYNNPEVFNPERFLDTKDHKAEMDPNQYIFGFGRRICPGKELALASMWLTIATTLAVFNIEKSRGVDGSEMTPSGEYSNGFVCHPEKFPCSITPRTSRSKIIIEAAHNEYLYEKGDSEALVGVEWGNDII